MREVDNTTGAKKNPVAPGASAGTGMGGCGAASDATWESEGGVNPVPYQ